MIYKQKLYVSIILLVIVVLTGVTGFMAISNKNFIDALYMTVITMSTVGYGTLHELSATEKILYIEGDAMVDETLQNVSIQNAKNLITALASDVDNLFVVLSTRQLNKDITIISRASSKSASKKLLIAGANKLLCSMI